MELLLRIFLTLLCYIPCRRVRQLAPPTAAGDADMDDAYHMLEEMPPSDPMASGGSFTGMLSDDVGIDDISFSMPYEQERYAQQDALTFLYQLQKKLASQDHPTTQHKRMRH